ncbi:2-octaprenyl-6-methoxyphenyl hydroxylase [Granulosicoccaceae sp. 1_MG-2023]|nr:2-octaprenyl-6-methoxyphenyl hydroxylase [Granulosicoccaceae sp. 1_MG-2023]
MTALTEDICIAGGGLVGGTLAWALANAGYQVRLIEPQAYVSEERPLLINERSIALSAGSRVILSQLGLWDGLAGEPATITDVHVSEKGRAGFTRLHAAEQGVPALGYVVPSSLILRRLYGRLDGLANLRMEVGAVPAMPAQQSDRVTYRLQRSGEADSHGACRLLLACDGTQSPLRSLLGIETRRNDYEQVAVLANVQCEKPHQGVAYERFTDEGPLALLPLGERHMAMVYTVEADQLEAFLALSEAQMLASLQRRFGYRLGRFTAIGDRVTFPLALIDSSAQSRGRVLLMGNAARTLHPVSGQGFNLALRDVAALLETLTKNGVLEDPGAASLLADFCAQRHRDQQNVVRFTDTLVRAFRGRRPLFSHLRALGLQGLDHVTPLKQIFTRHNMGMASRLPDLNPLQAQIRRNNAARQKVAS